MAWQQTLLGDLRPLVASLSLLAPIWGAALVGAVGVPVLAHLLSKRGGRVLAFPATRFVQQAITDTARMLRPRHWLLMLLRIAALALLVLAFMQPAWMSPVAGGVRGEAGVLAVLMVDQSASMSRASSGATLFDEARRRAVLMLDSLDPSRDVATVILVGRSPRPLLPEPTANFSALRAALMDARPTEQRDDSDEALALALRIAQGQADRRESRIEWFTDAQATTWIGADALASVEARGVGLRVHRLDGPQINAAARRPLIEPAAPVAGQRALVSVEVASFADQARTLSVRLEAEEQTHTRRVRLEPNTTTRVAWPVVFEAPGVRGFRFELEASEDAMGSDDAVGRFVRVAEARPVVLATRASADDARSAAYFVSRALVPLADDAADTGLRLTVTDPDALADQRDAGEVPAVWFFVEAGALDQRVLEAMSHHLSAGGGVVWVIDSAAAAASLSSTAAGLRVIEPSDSDPWHRVPRTISAARFDDALLEVFEGSARAGLIGRSAAMSLRGSLVPAADALLSFDDGRPAAGVRWVGPGRIAVVGFSLAPDDSDLARGPAFVALVQQLARGLAPGRPLEPNPNPGDPVAMSLHASGVAPGVGPLMPMDASTDMPVWIELDPDESDPRPAADDDPSADAIAQAGDAAGDPLLRATLTPLWPWLVLAALVLLTAEALVLLTWSGADHRAAMMTGSSDA